MNIAYIYPETLPSKYARTISVVNTSHEIANLTKCTLFIESESSDYFLKKYDINDSKLKIVKIPKKLLTMKSNKIFNHNLLNILKKEKFSFVYARHLKVAKFLIEKGFNVIFECHEIFHKSNIKIKETEEYVYKNAKGLVFINNILKNEFNKIFIQIQKNQLVAYNGIKKPSTEIRKDFFSIKKIFYTGNLFRNKGIEDAINTISHLDNIALEIIGKDSKERMDELKTMVIRQGMEQRIFFRGFFSSQKMEKLLQEDTKIAIIPKIQNNFSTPLRLLEYMSTKTITIAPKTPTVSEIIKDNVNGFLFDKNYLIDKIRKVLSADSKKLEKIANNAFEKSINFTWHNRAKQIVEWLKCVG